MINDIIIPFQGLSDILATGLHMAISLSGEK